MRSLARLFSILAVLFTLPACRSVVHEPFMQAEYQRDRDDDGRIDVWGQDLDGDRHLDYVELDDDGDGRVDRLAYRRADGGFDTVVRNPSGERPLIIICIDGVPAEYVRRMQEEGYFRQFHPAGRILGLFPSVTNESFTALWKTARVEGYEEIYYDARTRELEGSTWTYLNKISDKGESYHRVFDFERSRFNEILINFAPTTGYWEIDDCFEDEGLNRFVERIENGENPGVFIAYCISSDFLAHLGGESLLRGWLLDFDAQLQALCHRLKDRARIAVISDHGSSLVQSKNIALDEHLEAQGFQVSDSITDERSIAIPAFGLVGYAGIYCRPEMARDVAYHASTLEGVDLAAYELWNGLIQVFGVDGSLAEIARRGDRFRYLPLHGDPLGYRPLADALQAAGRQDADGFAHEKDWFDAARGHAYPDALSRLHHGFHGEVIYPANVLVSCKDGYCWGSSVFEFFSSSGGSHGSLRDTSTEALFLDTDVPPPGYVRIQDVLAHFRATGAPRDSRIYLDGDPVAKHTHTKHPTHAFCSCGATEVDVSFLPSRTRFPDQANAPHKAMRARSEERAIVRREPLAWQDSLMAL